MAYKNTPHGRYMIDRRFKGVGRSNGLAGQGPRAG